MGNAINSLDPISFYTRSFLVPTYVEGHTLFDQFRQDFNTAIWLQTDVNLESVNPNAAPFLPPGAISSQFTEWLYNSFTFKVTAPDRGWLLVTQLYDPAWQWTLDGKPVQPTRAFFMHSALPLEPGEHVIHMEYWPPIRRLYWPACAVLELVLLSLVILALRRGAKAQPGTTAPETPERGTAPENPAESRIVYM